LLDEIGVMETVTIPRSEYEELKKKAEVDDALVAKFKESFEAVKQGKVTEWKPR
jgi:uncharacterized protein (DUF924 family)